MEVPNEKSSLVRLLGRSAVALAVGLCAFIVADMALSQERPTEVAIEDVEVDAETARRQVERAASETTTPRGFVGVNWLEYFITRETALAEIHRDLGRVEDKLPNLSLATQRQVEKTVEQLEREHRAITQTLRKLRQVDPDQRDPDSGIDVSTRIDALERSVEELREMVEETHRRGLSPTR